MGKKDDALVVVAIDFGTTFSGYAYSFRDEYQKDHGKIYSNVSWESEDGILTPKTPTAILFENGEFHSFGYEAEETYNALLENGEEGGYSYFSRFKMKLFQDETSTHMSDSPRLNVHERKTKISMDLMLKDDRGNAMKAIIVFSQCIKFLKDHFIEAVKKTGQFCLKDEDIHWILTVPAIWKDNAKQFMREAARQAGIDQDLLTLAYEPEAAAICCKELTVKKKEGTEGCSLKSFEPGQQFLVLDCGGGTIDVTCYEIQNDSHLKELNSPTGGPWGGAYVNLQYMNFLENVFGKDVFCSFKEKHPRDFLELQRRFEAKKRGFKESSRIKPTIAYPQSLFQTYCNLRKCQSVQAGLGETSYAKTIQVTGDKLRFEKETFKDFFKTPILSIISHIRQLLSDCKSRKRRINSILMVGGFADSSVLFDQVKNEFPDLEVMRPQEAVTIVLRGAVMFGHNPDLISERVCPRTYGITINLPFDKKKHPERLQCIVEGKAVCTDIFKIIARKGESLIPGKTVKYITCYPTRSTDVEASVEVYESIEEEPMYTIDKGVRRLGTLMVPIPDTKRGKDRHIRIELHFGYTELLVSASEEDTNKRAEAKFECFLN